MKKILLWAALGLMFASCAHDDGSVTIRVPKNYDGTTLVVSHVTIDNVFKAKKQEDLKVYYDTLQVANGEAHMKLDPAGPARYDIEPPVASRTEPEFYAGPGDNIVVDITSFEPMKYTVSGTELMEDMTSLKAVTEPIQQEYLVLVSESDSVPQEKVKAIMDRYDASIKKFVADHPKSPVVPFAILDLSGDDFKNAYDAMSPEAKKSILMPYAELYYRQVQEMLQERQDEADRRAEVASGTITAPGFTLPALDGKKVSLSDYRGKWVVLDFWGSWCGWCVKGFPALKKAYEEYGDRIVIIGIDCNETEEEWRAGVKKHELPWLNLYNGNDRALYTDYNIEGFPTKAIINPEGKLVDLTTGEDPEFFTRLKNFVDASN